MKAVIKLSGISVVRLLGKKWVYFIFLFFFIATITGNYDHITRETFVFGSINITEALLPSKYEWEGYLILFDDQFQYFWSAVTVGWIWSYCKFLFDSNLISNRLWIKFTPVTEKELYKSKLYSTLMFSVILLIISSFWSLVFCIVQQIYIPIIFTVGLGMTSHLLFSSSIVFLLNNRFDPSEPVSNSILFLIVLLPLILGFLLGQINESFDGWLPYAVMGQAEVRAYPFFRPYISLLGLSFLFFIIGYWKIKE